MVSRQEQMLTDNPFWSKLTASVCLVLSHLSRQTTKPSTRVYTVNTEITNCKRHSLFICVTLALLLPFKNYTKQTLLTLFYIYVTLSNCVILLRGSVTLYCNCVQRQRNDNITQMITFYRIWWGGGSTKERSGKVLLFKTKDTNI